MGRIQSLTIGANDLGKAASVFEWIGCVPKSRKLKTERLWRDDKTANKTKVADMKPCLTDLLEPRSGIEVDSTPD